MADFLAQPGAQTLTGTSGNDNFIFNFDQVDAGGDESPEHDIDAGDVVNGGAGYDALWAGQTMQAGYSENFDFRPVTFISIEELDFNWMAMPMPGKLTFNSSQFGAGLSNNLVVKGAWDDNDITVYLDTANFDASGWTFPTPSTTTINGVPAGTSYYGWGAYIYTGSGIFHNLQVGETNGDTIHLIGSSASNTIVGSRVADIITSGGGDDVVRGGGAADVLDGGIGADTADYSDKTAAVSVTLNGSTASTVTVGGVAEDSIVNFENVTGGAGADTLVGDGQANMLNGGGGVDTLIGGGGADKLVGGAGADVMAGGTGDDIYYVDNALDSVTEAAGAGVDSVFAGVSYTLGAGQEIEYLRANAGTKGLTLTGNALDNKIYGGAGADKLNGGAGNDGLSGGAGADVMAGGIGNDSYYVDNALDSVTEAAGAGADTVYASVNYTLGAGQEIEFLRANAGATGLTLTGNALDNKIYGGSGVDTLNGGGGNDTLSGGVGADVMAGGTGNDIYYVDNALDKVTEAAGAGADTVYAGVNYTLGAGQEIEYLRANAGATGLTLTGNELANKIYGGSGVDTLNGGAGNDGLSGGGGADVMAGGIGNDSYYVDNALDSVTEAAGAGADTVYAAVNYTLGAGQEIEYLRANAGATGLTLTGNGLGNRIYGGSGLDTLNGGGGNDALSGGASDDTLNGGAGLDTLIGGLGADTFVFTSTSNGLDTISDFASGTDALTVSASNFGGGLVAGGAVNLVRAASAAAANAAGPYFIYVDTGPSAGTIYYDATGGSGADAVAFAKLSGTPALAGSDIQIVA